MSAQTPFATRQVAIAIVDDDPSVRVSLSRLCTALGLNATAYASGGEFLAALNGGASCPDCLLLDMYMPEMTGFELLRHLLARGTHIPTIVCTGGDVPEGLTRDATPGIAGYLHKPISAADLLAAIEQALHGRDQAS